MLAKVQVKARAIRKRHPNKSNAAVMKEAWSEARGGKLSGVSRRKAKKPRPKKAHRKTVIAREVHEVRRIGGISYTGGKVKISGAPGIDKAKRDLLHKLGEQAGWLELAISQERKATGRRALHKQLSQVRAEMRRIS